MKAIFSTLIVCVFPPLLFSQVNTDAAMIRSQGLREVRFYTYETDSFPTHALYYDKEGRVRKSAEIFKAYRVPSMNHLVTEEFDAAGRMTLMTFSYCSEKDLDAVIPDMTNGSTRTYFYYGDTLRIEMDSTWQNNRLAYNGSIKAVVRWQKTKIPHPRPVLWPDSIESSFNVTRKEYKYSYPDNLNGVIHIDSTVSVLYGAYAISNNRLTGTSYFKLKRENAEVNGELIKTYTLNQKYDTITWVSTVKTNDTNSIDHDLVEASGFGNYTFMRVIETKRAGALFFIYTNDTSSNDMRVNQECRNVHRKTTAPWEDSMITHYFEVDYYYKENYALYIAKPYFAADRLEKIKY